MSRIIRNLALLRNLGVRLSSLADMRGNPENVTKQHQDESRALSWAFNELRKEHLARLFLAYCAIGDEKHLPISSRMRPNQRHDMVAFIEMNPDEILVAEALDVLPNGEEIDMSLDKCPDWFFCDRVIVVNEPVKAVFIDGFLDVQWVSENGLGKAKLALMSWLMGLYSSL